MSWAFPLLLLALLLPAAGVYAARRRQSPHQAPRWPGMLRVSLSGNRLGAPRPPARISPYRLLAVLALGVIALAQPRWGYKSDDLYVHTREVMIALDLSRSMLADDVSPSRLAQARDITTGLLDKLSGESVGLTVFAGTAFVQVPLSPDYQIVREFLPSLDPDYMPVGGTDYTAMLDAVLDGFSEASDTDRYLVILSDGESSTDGWRERIPALAERQIHVIGIGLGTDSGGFIRDAWGGYMRNREGGTILTRRETATLQTLARRTNGRYVDGATLSGADDIRTLLADTVETGRKGRQRQEAGGEVWHERFQWFLLPAILIGLLALLKDFPRRPKPQPVERRMSTSGTRLRSGLAALIALPIAGGALMPEAKAHFDSEADFEVREVFDSNPVERLRAIVRHLADYGYDAYDLRLMVEEAIKYGIDAQRLGLQPREGVLRDAVAATHTGEALDTEIANWSFYRARLEAMLLPLEQAQAEARDDEERPRELMDEEDVPPVVGGQSTMQSGASDSFGQGAASASDAALGDLSTDRDVPIQRERPPPPAEVRAATVSASRSGGGGAHDAILRMSEQRLAEVVRRDSPGRLHQMLVGRSEQQQEPQRFDW
jgi:Ca-activated chloride channel family protein